jgi:dipeptidase
MLNLLFLIFLFNVVSVFAQSHQTNEFNCFSVLVGKNASADGSVLFAHNEDDYGKQIVNYFKVPKIQHVAGETITLATGAIIPQVNETYGFLWFEMPGMVFSDSYVNEWGVVIASDACESREENPELTSGGIKYWLRRLVAERARTAKQGVRIAGNLISELGYASSGRTYLIADSNEGWMLSAVNGKHWVAQRVPDDMVVVIPNYYTIGAVDLADTNNFLGSPDLIDYAIQIGWYVPEKDGEFHFARIYSSPGNLKNNGNVHRMWRGINLLAEKSFDLDDEFPFAFRPKKKVAVQDLMAVLRDHYVGTELDKTEGYRVGNPYKMNGSTICASSTQYGFVAQLRSWLPAEIGTVIWLAQYRPDSQAFIPWYLGVNAIPGDFAYGDYQTALDQHFVPPKNIHEKTDSHAYWTFVNLAEKIDGDYGALIQQARAKWDPIEKQLFSDQQGFEKKAVGIYNKDRNDAKHLLTEYTNGWAEKIRKMAKELVK